MTQLEIRQEYLLRTVADQGWRNGCLHELIDTWITKRKIDYSLVDKRNWPSYITDGYGTRHYKFHEVDDAGAHWILWEDVDG